MRRRLGLPIGLAAGLLAVVLWLAGVLDRAENLTWDWRVRQAAGASSAAPDIKLILLDQTSLDWGQHDNGLSWPWPREVYAAIVAFCGRAGVRTLSIDVLFTEPSFWGVWDDRVLGEAMATHGRTVAAAFVDQHGRLTRPIPEVRDAAARLGNVSGYPDPDGVYRRAHLGVAARDTVLPGLGTAAYQLHRDRADPSFGRADVRAIGGAHEPVILNYAPLGSYRIYNAAEIIQSELRLREGQEPPVDPEEWNGAHVLFGFSAPGLMDLRPTPLNRASPGVLVHATVLDNLLSDSFIRTVP